MGALSGKLKRLFWKLPLPANMKEQMRVKYASKKYAREDAAEETGTITLTNHDAYEEYIRHVLSLPGSRSEHYQPEKIYGKDQSGVTLAAYYLTQFHPTRQNDEWWGKGTTEWNNVCKAVPQFAEHYQPRIPGELGYYDLRIKENMARQIELAKNYGVNVFSFYYYWFDGERLLERPLNMFLEDKSLDMPFMICWANENWTKRFSGTDDGVLFGMTHDVPHYKKFIEDVWEMFLDARYYKINGRPVMQIYRPSLIPDSQEVLSYWRAYVKEKTGLDLYIIGVQENVGVADLCAQGYDAECEWQSTRVCTESNDITKKLQPLRSDFMGNVYDYKDMVENRKYAVKSTTGKKVYHSVMPMWDNTARRNQKATVFHGSTPALYRQWLSDVIKMTKKNDRLDAPLIFINAWNEWGEGAYLEPDKEFGYAYLQATRDAKEENTEN